MNAINIKKPEQIKKRRNNSAASKGVKHRKFTFSNQQLTDIVAAPIKVVIHGYGVNNLYYHDGQRKNDLIAATNVGDLIDSGGGNLKSLGCLPGRQVYFEDVALKYGESDGVSNAKPWTLNIKDMIVKACNDGHTFGVHSSQPAITMTSDINKINNKFIYHGGCVIHKFTNTLKSVCYMEFREFSPRQLGASFSYTSGGVTKYKIDGMYRTLFKDHALQHNGSTFPTEDGDNSYDEFDDKGFKYTSNCLLTNSRWVVGGKIMVKLMPGETYTYKMVLHPFSFKTSEFALLITNGSSGALNGPDGQPVELPGFTKHLYMRAWGEANQFSMENKWADGTGPGTATLDPMPSSAVDFAEGQPVELDAVATSSVRLAHTRSEYHTFRGVVQYANNNLNILKDLRDWGTTKYVAGTDPLMYNIEAGDRDVNADLGRVTGTLNGAMEVSQG